MAFAIRNPLPCSPHANGFTLWHYKAGKDRLNHIEEVDFFAGRRGYAGVKAIHDDRLGIRRRPLVVTHHIGDRWRNHHRAPLV